MPPSVLAAEMPSCATSYTLPAKVPTQEQVSASGVTRNRENEENLFLLLPENPLFLSKPVMDAEESSSCLTLHVPLMTPDREGVSLRLFPWSSQGAAENALPQRFSVVDARREEQQLSIYPVPSCFTS